MTEHDRDGWPAASVADLTRLVERRPEARWIPVAGKRPITKWRAYQPDPETVIGHLADGAALAIVPHSIGALVIDSDIRARSLADDDVAEAAFCELGEPGVWYDTAGGGRHLVYRTGQPERLHGLVAGGIHLGEVRCAEVLVGIHKPAALHSFLDRYEDCADIGDRLAAFLSRFDDDRPAPRPAPRPPREGAPVSTLDQWLDALHTQGGRPRREGPRWRASCPGPSHSNGNRRNPALVLGTGENGGVVAHCFRGCSFDDLLAVLFGGHGHG